MLTMKKGPASQSVGVNETLYSVESTGSPHKINSVEKAYGNHIELHFHMIGEFTDLCFLYYVGCKSHCHLLI
jgi:hypothetical protein